MPRQPGIKEHIDPQKITKALQNIKISRNQAQEIVGFCCQCGNKGVEDLKRKIGELRKKENCKNLTTIRDAIVKQIINDIIREVKDIHAERTKHLPSLSGEAAGTTVQQLLLECLRLLCETKNDSAEAHIILGALDQKYDKKRWILNWIRENLEGQYKPLIPQCLDLVWDKRMRETVRGRLAYCLKQISKNGLVNCPPPCKRKYPQEISRKKWWEIFFSSNRIAPVRKVFFFELFLDWFFDRLSTFKDFKSKLEITPPSEESSIILFKLGQAEFHLKLEFFRDVKAESPERQTLQLGVKCAKEFASQKRHGIIRIPYILKDCGQIQMLPSTQDPRVWCFIPCLPDDTVENKLQCYKSFSTSKRRPKKSGKPNPQPESKEHIVYVPPGAFDKGIIPDELFFRMFAQIPVTTTP